MVLFFKKTYLSPLLPLICSPTATTVVAPLPLCPAEALALDLDTTWTRLVSDPRPESFLSMSTVPPRALEEECRRLPPLMPFEE